MKLTNKNISSRYKTIKSKQQHWNTKLGELQDICSHPTASSKYCGNTGNYDPSSDSYWIEWSCELCGKRWDTEQ